MPDPELEEIGELVAATTREEQAREADRRVGRTAVQVGTPGAVVVLGTWAARLADIDLDPGAGVDLPAEVAGAWVAIIAVMLAWWMNRQPRG